MMTKHADMHLYYSFARNAYCAQSVRYMTDANGRPIPSAERVRTYYGVTHASSERFYALSAGLGSVYRDREIAPK